MGDVTTLIDRWNDGDQDALKELLAVLYPELRRLADDLLRHERSDHTLQPTALVHEAYIRLTGLREMRLDSRRHFYGAAAMSMRRILVDHARRRNAAKRGRPNCSCAARRSVNTVDLGWISNGSTRRSTSLRRSPRTRLGSSNCDISRDCHSRHGGRARHRACDGEAALELCAGLAVPRPERMTDPLTPSTGRLLTLADHAIVEEIFALALDLPAAERAALVATRSHERAEIFDEVNELLAAHDRAESFLPSAEGDSLSTVSDSLALSMVGHYRLLRRSAKAVWATSIAPSADGLFEHAVAIKVVRTSLQGADVLRRVLAERQILASLQHPNIITLLDAGATPAAQPYIVMELVDGVPLNTYCREENLALDARLRLFVQVCRAVQYAHQRAIVHRDLKPANILVTRDGVPKVLDFGIAKLLEVSPEAAATVTGMFPGPLTPNYASPEQLRGLPVTTACDVYALGILLYEIAAGARPYDTSGQTLDHVLEMVLRTDVVRDVPGCQDRARTWRSRLKGDLDAIVEGDREGTRSTVQVGGRAGRRSGAIPRRKRSLRRTLNRLHASAARLSQQGGGRDWHRVGVLILTALGVALWQRHGRELAPARAEEPSGRPPACVRVFRSTCRRAVAGFHPCAPDDRERSARVSPAAGRRVA
jgi:serine/threonine protein kinase